MHECPSCYQACYCGGDIDDIDVGDTAAANACDHCPIDGMDYDEDPDCYEDDPDVPFPFTDHRQMTLDDEIRSDAP